MGGEHKLSSLGKGLCVSCRKAPPEGTYKKKGKDRPHTARAARSSERRVVGP
jgi:hypothetical protein